EGFHLYEGDIRDHDALKQVFEEYKPDIVIHLAAMAGVQPSLLNPDLYYDVNTLGTLQVLKSCAENKVSKLIFASSSSVYGDNETPFHESDCTDYPISPYASSKKAAEVLCHVYHSLHNISVHCLRFFTVVGPRQRPDLAVHKFVKAISSDHPVQLRGKLSCSRDYTSVFDTVQGIMGSLRRIKSLAAPEYKIYNLGNSYPIRLDDMLNTIEASLNRKAKIEYVEFMEGDVKSTFADISLAKKELGYDPQRSFRDAVDSFVEWYSDFNRTRI
ncbi:MAG TPA: NAD-dependent epimerase/dehydratase family protein, partial [Candidatus Cloacimonetes bacterium]|nr:NAD-dependent epimerase/dehydratase family protein [Candidatus Cloacimonadota bacterium]